MDKKRDPHLDALLRISKELNGIAADLLGVRLSESKQVGVGHKKLLDKVAEFSETHGLSPSASAFLLKSFLPLLEEDTEYEDVVLGHEEYKERHDVQIRWPNGDCEKIRIKNGYQLILRRKKG